MADGTFLEMDEDSVVLLDATTNDADKPEPKSNSSKDPIFRNLLAAGDLDTPIKPPPQLRSRHPSSQDHMKVFLRIRPLPCGEGQKVEQVRLLQGILCSICMDFPFAGDKAASHSCGQYCWYHFSL